MPEYLEANKEKNENKVFYVTDEIGQGQYIKMFKDENMDAVILKHNIDNPFITHLEQKNEKVKFLRIDADLNDSLKEEATEEDKKSLEEAEKQLSEIFKKALNNDKLQVKAELLKDKNISSMVTLSEENRRMADMMKMYGMSGMDASMFGNQVTLILNAGNDMVKYIQENKDSENVPMFCEQLYDLALISHEQLSPEAMTKFIERSNKIMMLLTQ